METNGTEQRVGTLPQTDFSMHMQFLRVSYRKLFAGHRRNSYRQGGRMYEVKTGK
jgi:hypothetical protein